MFENFVLTSTVIAFICTPKKHNKMKLKKILQEMQCVNKWVCKYMVMYSLYFEYRNYRFNVNIVDDFSSFSERCLECLILCYYL